MNKTLCLISIVLLMLSACQAPTPSAPVAQATVTPRPIVQAATKTAAPPNPTVAPTTAPTQTAAPLPTATPTAAATAAATLTSTPTAAPPTATAVSSNHDVYISGDGTNFRDAPSTGGNVLQVLPQGTHLTVIGAPTAPDAGGIAWQNVRTDDGRSGWVAVQLLSSRASQTPTPEPPPAGAPSGTPSVEPTVTPIAPAGYVYVISIAGLNMRADHTVSSNMLATLANGQRLQTNGLGLGPDDQGIQWLNVKTDDGTLGWVAVDYVSTQAPSVSPAQAPVNDNAIAAELLRRTNELRQQNGLPPYVLSSDLTQLALAHSQYMAQNGITHSGADGLSAKQRINNAGYGAGNPTENIFGGQATIEDAWDYWKSDPPHLRNLLDPVNTVIGIGVYRVDLMIYYTQDFGKPTQ
jgi:uncharacterized protein YkwD